jgi:hypothetical protein
MRIFKITARENANYHYKWLKKRIYTSLIDFNKYCVNAKIEREWTLYRYKDIYADVKCYEKIEDKWIEIYPEIWKEYI